MERPLNPTGADTRKTDARKLSLASVREINSPEFIDFMMTLNEFASIRNLRQFTNWSKNWEYPWVWFNGLQNFNWKAASVVDYGSELSPMPWYFASLGAEVTLIEKSADCITKWNAIRDMDSVKVKWHITQDERLPLTDETCDLVTSFSVIEHQSDKGLAIREIIRILKPGGILAISFDVCEPALGMTFPEWNGRALTMKEFEDLVWNNPWFVQTGPPTQWNVGDCQEFIRWHLRSALHHNYTVGAAILRRR